MPEVTSAAGGRHTWLEGASPQVLGWLDTHAHRWQRERRSFEPSWHHLATATIDVPYRSPIARRGHTSVWAQHNPGATRPTLQVEVAGAPPSRYDALDLVRPTTGGQVALKGWSLSPRGRHLALVTSTGFSDVPRVLVVDVVRAEVVATVHRIASRGVAWGDADSSLFYIDADKDEFGSASAALMRATWDGERVATVIATLETARPRLFDVIGDDTGRWLVVSVGDGSPASGNQLWLHDAERGGLTLLQDWGAGNGRARFGPDGRLYLVTNRTDPNRAVHVAAPDDFGSDWQPLIAARPDAVIVDVAFFGSDLVVSWRKGPISEVTVHETRRGAQTSSLKLPGLGVSGPVHVDVHAATISFSYSDCLNPPVPLTYDKAETGWVLRGDLAGASRRPAQLVRHQVTCSDGAVVDVYLAGAPVGGPQPLILTAYGGFGVTLELSYWSAAAAWTAAGGRFGWAMIRGGGDHGPAWHEAGRGRNKPVAVSDLLDCAQSLVEQGYTGPASLALWGGSNGGLLACAAAVRRPDLIAAVFCEAPLCDMLRYQCGSSAARYWAAEYGDTDDPVARALLASYSPYHNVVAGRRYPAMLFAVSEEDPRVPSWHSRKMVAALEDAGANSIFYRGEARPGHGERPTAGAVDLTADALAFLGKHTGLHNGGHNA